MYAVHVFDTYFYYSCIHVNLWEGGMAVSLITKFIILKRKQFWEQHITYLTQSYNTFNCLPIFLSGTVGSLTVPSKEEKHFPDLKWSSVISDITWKRINICLAWFVLYLNNFKCYRVDTNLILTKKIMQLSVFLYFGSLKV